MISWLEGKKIQIWNQGSRKGLVLACNGVGYEVQISQRTLISISNATNVSLWIHQLFRDDGYYLFGFLDQNERDLFRKLISVSGVGPQLGMSLLEDNDYQQLLSSIINNDISQLTRSSGVGKRTAERLVLELKNKLSDLTTPLKICSNNETNPKNNFSNLDKDVLREVVSALKNLDYSENEINNALIAATKTCYMGKSSENVNNFIPNEIGFEELFKEALSSLNNESGFIAT